GRPGSHSSRRRDHALVACGEAVGGRRLAVGAEGLLYTGPGPKSAVPCQVDSAHRTMATLPSNAVPPATSIEDVQARADSRQLPINKVGIKDVYHPVRVKDRSSGA